VLLGSTEIVADSGYLEQFLDRLMSVTPEAIQTAAARLFADRNRTVGWYLPDAGSAAAAPAQAGPATEAAAHA
jgi:predicted Zn-dependent peptidase